MKAISLWQPWATAIAFGVKKYETRHWSTPYRGLLAIHAAKHIMDKETRLFAMTERTLGRLPARIPFGAMLCIVELVSVEPTEEVALRVGAIERMYGDYTPGRFAWRLRLLEVFNEPIACKGHQGFFDWRPRWR